jgi:hypothetical protein
MHKRSALSWGITQRRVVILDRRFGTTYWSRLQWSRSLRRVEYYSSWADTLSRNVGKGLPLDAAQYLRSLQISSASRRKREITVMHKFNPLKTKRICFIKGLSAYRAVNTLHFGYKNQSLDVL